MDTNGLPIEGILSTNLPLGLGAAPPLPADMSASLAPGVASVAAATTEVGATDLDADFPETSTLTEAEKEQRLFARKDAELK
ncbi:MAG: hypothetical protein E7292_06400 [Lachnospiraceae bacterium]|nr:hypothetical protein [Lachnospiraceae bacterium]